MDKDRTYCGDISSSLIDKDVTVMGWADTIRDHGGLIFIELRDVSGKVQTVFDSSNEGDTFSAAETVKNEYVLLIKGKVRKRSADTINPNIPNGDIEIIASVCDILNTANTLPFPISDSEQVGEETRLKYRFLDLRRTEMQDAMVKRHISMQTTRNFLSNNKFLEIETPILNKSTPEGARDFLVPSRMNRGSFYALPQSPQLFKQILMVGGYDRYFQIIKCFRDEDLRNDRQPEFTQIDMELSFVTPDMVISIIEGLLKEIVKDVCDKKVTTPFQRITYQEAMDRYGTDAPDTRIPFEIRDCSDIFSNSEFNVFSQNLKKGGVIKGIAVPDDPKLSRTVTDGYSEYVRQFGAGGFPMCKYIDGKFQGGIFKFISDDEQKALVERFNISGPSVLFFSSDKKEVVNQTLSNMRIKIAEDLDAIDDDLLNFIWVTDFPLFEYNGREKRFQTMHHPFTAPIPEQEDMLDSITGENAADIKAQAYDVVLNGVEIGGGSIRINNSEIQKKIFTLLNMSEEEINTQFSFLMDALKYGAPPHGGIALGLDRILMILLKKNSIREVIAFPKTQKGQCLMSSSPTEVSSKQLKELSIRTIV